MVIIQRRNLIQEMRKKRILAILTYILHYVYSNTYVHMGFNIVLFMSERYIVV